MESVPGNTNITVLIEIQNVPFWTQNVPSKMADGKQSESNERYVFNFVGVTVYLVATPPPVILSLGTLNPGKMCPTLVYLVPEDTLPRGIASLPQGKESHLKFISYLFFLNICFYTTYFIALK